MENWKEVTVSATLTIRESMQIMDRTGLQIVLIVDEQETLLGVVTDGDIRRAVLNDVSLQNSIETIMNRNPLTLHKKDTKRKAVTLLRKYQYRHLPVIDDERRLVSLMSINDIIGHTVLNNTVIIMAGGLGTRLRPLTEHIPKPMLKVGDRPILETILENFIEQGFSKFIFSVNYKSELIVEHFKNGEAWGVEIDYIYEDKRLGTAGALSLLKQAPQEPMIVMNGDLLTKVDFQSLLSYHSEQATWATMCVRTFEYQVPYGVINVEDHRLVNIEEKPIQKFFVNAGIYVINPQALTKIPYNEFYDMPTLFNDLIEDGQATSVFPIREYWMDIGQMKDFEQAQSEFSAIFRREGDLE